MNIQVRWFPEIAAGSVTLRPAGPAGQLSWQPVRGLTLWMDRAEHVVLKVSVACDLDGDLPPGTMGVLALCFGEAAAAQLGQARTTEAPYEPGNPFALRTLQRLGRAASEAAGQPLKHLDATHLAHALGAQLGENDELGRLVRDVATEQAFRAAHVLRRLPAREVLDLDAEAEAAVAQVTAQVADLAGDDVDLGPINAAPPSVDWDLATLDLLSQQAGQPGPDRLVLRSPRAPVVVRRPLDLSGMLLPPGLSAEISQELSRVTVTVTSDSPLPPGLRVRAIDEDQLLLADNLFWYEQDGLRARASLFVSGEVDTDVFLDLAVGETSPLPLLPVKRCVRAAEAVGQRAAQRQERAEREDIRERWIDAGTLWELCADAWSHGLLADEARQGLALTFAENAYRQADDRRSVAACRKRLHELGDAWRDGWDLTEALAPSRPAPVAELRAALPSMHLENAVNDWVLQWLQLPPGGDADQAYVDVEAIGALGSPADQNRRRLRAQLRLGLGERARFDGNVTLLAAVLSHVVTDHECLGPEERRRLAVLGTAPIEPEEPQDSEDP